MAQIHVLDSETIDKIAAGEVVERPASVVKELVENAIDAGATAITVEARDGGIEFLRVTDNGSGMAPDQVRTAFLRHATSKIGSAADLSRISSLGFRGEALSSIAAVSKVEMITKTKESLTGIRFVTEGAQEKAFEEVGAPDGTTFLMRNLFYNTPVRRKFLKQPATEGGYIADLMEHLALSRPDISFKFLLGSQERFHTSGNGDLREVIYRLYGRDIAAELVPLRAEREGTVIEGYLGKPVLGRANRNLEIYFINRRFVRSQLIARAIEEGYREYLMQHKFPLCVLHIQVESQSVDVNVHPAKMDVRFSNGPAFCDMLTGVVREGLRQREMIQEVSLTETVNRAAGKTVHKAVEVGKAVDKTVDKAVDQQSVNLQEKSAFHENSGETMATARFAVESSGSAATGSQESVARENQKSAAGNIRPAAEEDFGPASEKIRFRSPLETDALSATTGLSSAGSAAAGSPDPAVPQRANYAPEPFETVRAQQFRVMEETRYRAEEPGLQQNLFEEKILTVENRSRYQIIGQVFETYWIVEFEGKMLIIDQHAAHEKVKYERLMKQYRERQPVSQNLMPPIIVSLTAQDEVLLREHQEAFASLGFEVEPFGGSEYALRAVPTDLYGCGERELFLAALDALAEEGGRGTLQAVEEKIASMSCKAAVKGNHRLSRLEAEALIDELLTLENPYHCPHGRPTIISMTKTELEKKFKRIV